ncbi:MAG: DUF1592 domain-containing protein [Polyangiaceae bacterium]|nr:DUF1592 domain-containing protein [Polyangiaceae bacterium]
MRSLAPKASLGWAENAKKARISYWLLGSALALGCTANVPEGRPHSTAADPNGSGATGSGPLGGGAGPSGAGGSTSGSGGSVTGPVGTGGSIVIPENCNSPVAPRAPMRRLSRFEYTNTMRDLVGDTTSPGNDLAAEDLGNGFSNDADTQTVSSLLAGQYVDVAAGIATRAMAPGGAISKLNACATSVPANTAAETDCFNAVIPPLATGAYRRPLAAGEAEELLALFQTLRNNGSDFASSLTGVVQALLLTPDFLYRPEFGVPVPGQANLLRPTGYEMATRLSYLYFGSMPDAELAAAAARGELDTADGVLARATAMVNDPMGRAATNVGFFFDNLLPIARVGFLSRDAATFPTYSTKIGLLMRQETQAFVKGVIFQENGTLDNIYTAPYTYVNDELAAFYGIAGVTGSEFRQVPLPDTTKRLGLLTQGAVLMGPIATNVTSPVARGGFLTHKLLCQEIPKPSAAILAMIKPPDPYSAPTARERFALHSKDPGCAGCHQLMDPAGLALENFDAVGMWRDQENGVTIDASGTLAVLGAPFNGPVELAQRTNAAMESKTCFSKQWMNFAYGRTLNAADKCTQEAVQSKFTEAGSNVKALLTALAQSDAFLYLNAVKE